METVDVDGFLASLDRWREFALARCDDGISSDDLYRHQPALLAYTAGAIIRQLGARVAELERERAAAPAECDRLRDILRCERGEWAPEGWEYRDPDPGGLKAQDFGIEHRRWCKDDLRVYRRDTARPYAVARGSVIWIRGFDFALEAIETADIAAQEVPDAG